MDNQTNNPLTSFFRQPAIHVKLPSQGKFWGENALNLPVTGEVPIYPMTTKDEITLRTPDALLNGAGVVSVIQSCCPNIVDAWQMPSIDVDAVLIAIRIASYGNSMDIDTECPHCKEENMYGVDLGVVLSNIKTPNYDEVVKVDGLEIKLHPQLYFSVNKTNMVNFEEQRILQTINDTQLTNEEKTAKFNEHLQRLIDLNLTVMVDSTESIKTPTGQVVNNIDFIREFYQKTSRTTVKKIRDWLEAAASDASIKPVPVQCTECNKSFDVAVTFDYAHFFV